MYIYKLRALFYVILMHIKVCYPLARVKKQGWKLLKV